MCIKCRVENAIRDQTTALKALAGLVDQTEQLLERTDVLERKVSEMEEQDEYRKATLKRENALTAMDYALLITMVQHYYSEGYLELEQKLINLHRAESIK